MTSFDYAYRTLARGRRAARLLLLIALPAALVACAAERVGVPSDGGGDGRPTPATHTLRFTASGRLASSPRPAPTWRSSCASSPARPPPPA